MKKISKIVALMLTFSMLLLSLTACSNPTKDAEAAVTRNFEELKALDDEVYDEYFGDDSLADLGLEGSEEDFKMFTKTLMENIDYKIVSSEKVDDDTVIVKVDVTAIKMEVVMKNFIESVMKFSLGEDVNNLTEDELNKKVFELLVKAISQPDLEKVTTTVDITVKKEDDVWDFEPDDAFIDAIYGGMLKNMDM